MKQSLVPLLILLQLTCVAMQEVRYVKPLNASSFSCPHQPCLTLDQYARSVHAYFTAGSTFVFLPGNHGLQSIISLSNISNITLRGIRHNFTATIICMVQYAFFCENVSNLTTQWLTFDLTNSLFPHHVTAMKISNSRDIMISDCTFKGSRNDNQMIARALYITESSMTITRSLFEGNTGYEGGAIHATLSSFLFISESVFVGNNAGISGGAIAVESYSTMVLTSHNHFSHNRAVRTGGAINCARWCTIIIAGNVSFENNLLHSLFSSGVAVYIYGHIETSGTVVFSNNEAQKGGGIYMDSSTALFSGESILFSHNSAEEGGGIFTMASSMKVNATFVKFDGNVAKRYGGGLSTRYTGTVTENVIEISATFSHNKAECGSAIFIGSEEHITFIKVSIIENYGSGLCFFNTNVTFSGTTIMSNNVGITGGSISNKGSLITFTGPTWFDSNTAQAGGAINSIQGEIAFHSTVLFTHNSAHSDGGAIYAQGLNIVFKDIVEFNSNSALNGGAIYLSRSTLTVTNLTVFSTLQNHAAKYGGAIYHEDSPTPVQCNFRAKDDRISYQFLHLPKCFLQSTEYYYIYGTIHSYHDSAGKDGYFLYGGLLDKCKQTGNIQISTLYSTLLDFDILTIEEKKSNTTTKNITSEATELHLCKDYLNNISIEVFRGETFTVALLAVAQADTAISTQVIAITQSSRLGTLQSIQDLPEGCSDMVYSLYSAEAYDQLILYPDGPCRDSGLARVTSHGCEFSALVLGGSLCQGKPVSVKRGCVQYRCRLHN